MNQYHVVTNHMLRHLPEAVRCYMNYTGVIGKPWIETVRLKQIGKFRKGLDQPWMPTTAEQVFTTDPPGFIWKARFKMAGLPLMRARDSYQTGHGHMFGKLAGLFTIFDERGAEMDQGTLMRYLGEIVWFPTAFLGENITWRSVNDHVAEVTLIDGDRSISACLTIDDDGRLINFSAMRYGNFNGAYALYRWSVPLLEYARLAGLNIPVRGQVVWNLPTGDVPYFDWTITSVEYNGPIEPF